MKDLAEINPRRPREIGQLPDGHMVTFVPMPAVCADLGVIANPEIRPLKEVRKGFTYFAENDVIFAKITPCMQNGKSAIARGLSNRLGFGSTEFHVIRPDPGKIIPEWIHYYVRQMSFRTAGTFQFRGAVGQQRVPPEYLANATIPYPTSIDEQLRIVARIKECMDRVDEIEGLRSGSEAEAQQFLRSYYHDLYEGMLTRNPTRSLGDCGVSCGGGTPSKSRSDYWNGSIPWVSPKEMKTRDIQETSLNITESAIQGSSVKLLDRPAVLFVVRGMILAHTLPVAVNRVPVTLNQDMKGILPSDDIGVDFLATMVRGAERRLLGKIEIAGHGTCRLQTEHWSSIPIPKISIPEQEEVLAKVASVESAADALRTDVSMEEVSLLRESILRKAFAGEL
jgi:type I restriction enzyme S subunit